MSEPLISVLIPAYNRADTIGQCIASAQAGGHENLEIIVSDNASTDGTAGVVAELATRDPRIILLQAGTNLGPLPNWKVCLDQATGDLIHWLWSDDWIAAGFYTRVLAAMSTIDAKMGMSAATITDPEAGWWYTKYSHPSLVRKRDELLSLASRGFDLPVSPAACLLPTASVRKHFTISIPIVSGLDCNRRAIGCDQLMIMGAIHDSDGRCAFVPEPLAFFRDNPTSISVCTEASVRNAHYAWARSYWQRQHGLPRSWRAFDFMRLIHDGRWMAAIRSML